MLDSSGRERLGPVRMNPEEGHGNDQRAGAHLLCRQADRVGIAQSGQEKDLRRP